MLRVIGSIQYEIGRIKCAIGNIQYTIGDIQYTIGNIHCAKMAMHIRPGSINAPSA